MYRLSISASLSLLLFLSLHQSLRAQQDIAQLRQTAQTFQRQGDYANALLVLNRALQQDVKNMDVLTDIAHLQYLQRDFTSAVETVKPLVDRDDAEVRTFQVAGNIYKALESVRDCEKAYRKGLMKFPSSGALHSELGELLWAKKEAEEAIATWENGIRLDPSFSGNYYHAAKFYFALADKVWSLVYGEVFLNLESYSTRTTEIKLLLLESYKKYFTDSEVFKAYKARKKSPFEDAFLSVMDKQSPLAAGGITTSSLLSIRTRFLLEWFDQHAARFPHKLLDQQQYLAREGMFEAYNQWLFGAVSSIVEYQHWAQTHPESVGQFSQYQRNRVFRMPAGQYYGPATR
jgi:tetratricopeptide (TPR) repeat protein